MCTSLLSSMYPEITSASQRQEYKKVFDSDLWTYQQLCAQLDHINGPMSQLARELCLLSDGDPEHQVRAPIAILTNGHIFMGTKSQMA